LYVTVKCIVKGRFFPVPPRRGIENDHTFDQYLSVFSRDFLVLNSAPWWVPFKSIKLASYLLGTPACTPPDANPNNKKLNKISRSQDLTFLHHYTIQKRHNLDLTTKQKQSNAASTRWPHPAP
jgi:hypothetical protein